MKLNKENIEPDNTAVRTALWRALHVQADANPHIFEDEIGMKLIAPPDDYDTTYFYLAQKTIRVTDEHFTGSLGWETYNEKGKHHTGAFGSTGGYTAGIIFERNERVGIVVLSNVSAYTAPKGSSIEDLCKELYGPLPFDKQKDIRK